MTPNRPNREPFTPYVRYFLIFLSSWLVSGDRLPEPMEEVLARMALDPAVVSDLAGFAALIATLVWYQFSRAKRALKEFGDLFDGE